MRSDLITVVLLFMFYMLHTTAQSVTVAGVGSSGNVNGPGTLARFHEPRGVVLDSNRSFAIIVSWTHVFVLVRVGFIVIFLRSLLFCPLSNSRWTIIAASFAILTCPTFRLLRWLEVLTEMGTLMVRAVPRYFGVRRMWQ